jgi:DNA invertase Pin-like site-specific DNA recombinase
MERTQPSDCQENACRNLCAQKGYNVFKFFVGAGESARTTDRSAFQETHRQLRSPADHALI